MHQKPVFSIIIPVKELNKNIIKNIKYIKKQNFKNWELLIVTNNKTFLKYPEKNIRVICSGKVAPGRKRDIGEKYSSGKYLVFLDDDSYPAKNYLDLAFSFVKKNILVFGGPGVTPNNNSLFQKISGSFFLSKYSGNNPERYIPLGKIRFFDDWPTVNFIINKKLFKKIGGFNNDFWPGEDSFLCEKLHKYKKKILYIPNLIVYHDRRKSLSEHLKQINLYGKNRGFFFKNLHSNSFKFKNLMPSLFVIFTLISFVNFIISETPSYLNFFWLLYLYIIFKSFIDIKKYMNFKISFFTMLLIPLSHISYGIGFIWGIIRNKNSPELR
jgi:GT2 family glycosyltransferase